MNVEERPVTPATTPSTTPSTTPPPAPASTAAVPAPAAAVPVAAPDVTETQEASTLAKDTHEQDPLGLGRTAGQRTAEVFAGLRAELTRSPEATALTRISGRVTARMIKSVGKPKVLNFVPVRDGSFAGLIKQELGETIAGKVLVELAIGFSPRGIQLAREMPELQVIEIDLPDVIEEKQKRLHRARITVPPNLTYKSADLGVLPLSKVLDGQKVDVVTAEGLMPYFEFKDITRIAKQVKDSLRPGGAFIADLGFSDSEGAKEASGLVQIFRRYTRASPGAVNDEATAYRLFNEAAYDEVKLYRMPQTAAMFNLPQPVSDVLFFMVSRKK